MVKILTWLKMNGASLLGALQLVIKAVKEAITAIVNLVSIVIPAMAAEAVILKVRGVCEAVDGWIEKVKVWLLAIVTVA
jgi:hypothetical protein